MLPILEIFTLFEVFVKPVQLVLLVLTAMICVVSGVSILVSIYNSMAGRRHEIAVMRALGASRTAVLSIVLIESIMLSVGGGAIGWVLGHMLNWLASPIIERRTGVSIGFFDFAPSVNLYELLGGTGNVQWMSISSEILLDPVAADPGRDRRLPARAGRVSHGCGRVLGQVVCRGAFQDAVCAQASLT